MLPAWTSHTPAAGRAIRVEGALKTFVSAAPFHAKTGTVRIDGALDAFTGEALIVEARSVVVEGALFAGNEMTGKQDQSECLNDEEVRFMTADGFAV